MKKEGKCKEMEGVIGILILVLFPLVGGLWECTTNKWWGWSWDSFGMGAMFGVLWLAPVGIFYMFYEIDNSGRK